MARKKPAWMRTRDMPSKPIDVIDVRYRDDGAYQHTAPAHGTIDFPGGRNTVDVEIRSFDVYLNGVWKGKFDNSPRGLIEFAEAMR
jgi:hypothetical protein